MSIILYISINYKRDYSFFAAKRNYIQMRLVFPTSSMITAPLHSTRYPALHTTLHRLHPLEYLGQVGPENLFVSKLVVPVSRSLEHPVSNRARTAWGRLRDLTLAGSC